MANTLYNKSSRTQIYKTLPSNDVGFDGDSILSQIQGRGVYLCSKVNGRWHVSSKMEELRKIENTSTKDLITNKLTVIDNLDIVRISEIASDTDKFLMLDGNTVKFVTGANLLSYSGGQAALTFGISDTNVTKCGAGIVDDDFIRVNGTTFEGRSASEVLSDIGGQASLTFGISNTNAVKIDAADVADDDYARFTANGLEGRTLAEIKSDIGTGNSALVPSAGTSGHFLKHDGTFGQVAYSNLSGTPTIPTNYVTNDASDSMAGTLTSVINFSGTSTASNSSFISDLNNTGNTGSGQTRTSIGFEVDYDYTGTNNTGAITTLNGVKITSNTPACNLSNINNYGIVTVLTGDNSGSGTVRQTGLDFTLTGGSTAYQTGLLLNTDDGSTDIKIVSSADTGDYFSIATTTHGATTIATVDDDATAAHLTLDIDGDITLDANGGDIIFQNSGTEYGRVNQGGFVAGFGATPTEYGDGAIMEDGSEVLYFAADKVTVDYHLYISEVGSAEADAAGKGQLWVKNDTPNNLYFTNDAGNDVQITNGASLAGSGGSSGLNSIVAAMVFG